MILVADRGIGEVTFLRDVLSKPTLDILGLVTHLGSVAVLVVVVAGVYWLWDRQVGIFAFGTGAGAVALTWLLKGLFMFPSGHALVAMVTWGALAIRLDNGSRGLRWGVAGSIIVLVGFSRIALGVHYLIDVVVGIALGVGYLRALLWWGRPFNDPIESVWIAITLGVPATIITVGGTTPLSLSATGISGILGLGVLRYRRTIRSK